MTSVMGILSTKPRESIAGELDQMLAAAPREPWYVEGRRIDGTRTTAVGRLTHDGAALGQAGTKCDGISGEVTLFGDLYALPAEQPRSDRAGAFLRGYAAAGDRFLEQVQGGFIAIFADDAKGVVRVINDRFGQRPLYWTADEEGLRFSTSLPALFAAGAAADVSPEGLAQFFTFGQYLGCHTMYRNIQVLPAGGLLEFQRDSGRVTVRSYTANRGPSEQPRRREDWLEAICAATVAAVRRCSRGTDGLGLALSGGLDARTILGLVDHREVDLKTICLGMPGSLDLRCAEAMATRLGCRHHNHLLDDGFLAQFPQHLERMVELTGGQYLSQCIVMPTLPVYRQQGIRVLLRGHAGELMHMEKAYAYSLDREAMQLNTTAEAKAWLFSRLQAYMLEGVPGQLFRGSYARAMETAPRAAFDEAFAAIPSLEDPRQAIWHCFVAQRLRRETTLSLGKFASVCDVRVPMLDRDLIDLLLAAPVELKRDETIQRYILQRCRPELLHVINANVGTPMTAGPLRRRAGALKLRACAKLGLPGYQPYERMGLWLRRELRGVVRELLLDPRCLDRGVFQPETVRGVIESHESKRGNHTFLLLAMMTFEVAQRRFADRAAVWSEQASCKQEAVPANGPEGGAGEDWQVPVAARRPPSSGVTQAAR